MITLSHSGFFVDDTPFTPTIAEGDDVAACNGVRIVLPARLADELDWAPARAAAHKAVAEGKRLFWEFDFGWGERPLLLDDQAPFFAFSIALEQFKSALWPEFQQQTIGAAIYRGDLDLPNKFIWRGEEALIDVFAGYLHRLLSFLPDELNVFCLIDVSAMTSQAEIARLLSKERFAHLQLAVKGASIPINGLTWEYGHAAAGWIGKTDSIVPRIAEASFAVCLPPEEALDKTVTAQLDAIFETLKARGVVFRIVPEALLNEQWDGLDTVLVISQAVSAQGKRKLQGFCAAGGAVALLGPPLGLATETLFTL